MTWKLLLVTLPLLAVGLAGCLGDDDADDVDAGPEGAGAQAAYVLDCSIGGNGWAEPCLAWASPNESPSKTEIDLVVNPTDPLNVVVASKDLDRAATNDCVWSVAQVTYDGGHTWNTSYVGGTIADRQPGDPLYGWDCVTDPIMTFNRDGDLFYNLQAYRLDGEPPNPAGLPGPDAAMMGLFISRDGGTTWPDFVLQQPGDDLTVFPDYMHMGTNPATGSVFTAWNNIVGLATSTPTVAAYRGDPLPIATLHPLVTPDSPTGTGESSIVGANDGTVYAWLGGFNSPDVAYYSISTDDGLTWSLPAEAFPFTPMAGLQGVEFRDGTAIELAVDNSGGERDGCLYAAWGGQEAGVAGGTVDGSDIYVRRSCDGAAAGTWTDPVLVNTAPETRVAGQWMPRVAVDGLGGVHVVYLTQAYDLVHGNSWVDAEWAYSTDGGGNWTTQRLTTVSFDGDLGIHQNGGPFLGDYIGIGAVGGDVYMGFPTTLTGVAEIAVAHAVATAGVDAGATTTA